MVALIALWANVSAAAIDDIPSSSDQRVEQLRYDSVQNRWVSAPRPVPGTEDGDLDLIRQRIAREDYKSALKDVTDWIEAYGLEAPRYPEALYLQGTAELELGEYRAADKAYQEVLNDYPGYGGVEIMDDVVVNYADTPLAEQAQLAKADAYYARGEFMLAEDEYARFARDYPRSRYQAKALLWSAYAALASFPGIEFDDTALVESEERFLQFLDTYPDQAKQLDVPILLDQIGDTRADKTLSIARFYERTDHPDAARYYYRAAANRWPDSPAASEARTRLQASSEPEPLAPTEPSDAPTEAEPPQATGEAETSHDE